MSSLSDKLHSAPFIRLLVPLIAGIVSGSWFAPEQKWFFLLASLVFSFGLCFFVTITYKRESYYGFFLFPALLFLGIFVTLDRKYEPQPLPAGNYFAVLNEFPIEKEKSYRAIIRLIQPKIKVLAYFEKSDSISHLEPGTVLWFHGKPDLLQKTGNPFEFDYQAYAIRNNIGHRIYLKNKDVCLIKTEKNLTLLELSLIIRDRLLKIIEKSGLSGEVFHLVSAISLGAREELEPETTQSFSKTGVIHVLAVSGMNVGIIYIVLDLLLRFLKRRRGGIILHTLLILSALWGYALITGLSASVLRAAAMFSFIVIGTNLSRHPNIYNTLAASAFVLLCIHPSLLYDVGFQLSYAAVWSIIFFHPHLYPLLYFKYWIPDQIWSLLTVSMAAQIGTIPFLLHYFHQFPTWFLLANLMVIPLVTLILYLAFIVFIVAPIFPLLGVWMTRVLGWAGEGMLFSVHFVERLPYALLEGLYPSDLTLLLVVLFAILFSLFIIYKNHPALTAALAVICMLLMISDIMRYQKTTQKELVIFNLQGKTLMALTSASETVWLTTDKNSTIENLKYYTKPYEGYRSIKKSSIICLPDSSERKDNHLVYRDNFLNFEGISIALLRNQSERELSTSGFPVVDIVVLEERSKIPPTLLRRIVPEALIVLSGSVAQQNESHKSNLPAINDSKIMNLTAGALRITISKKARADQKSLKAEYFNH